MSVSINKIDDLYQNSLSIPSSLVAKPCKKNNEEQMAALFICFCYQLIAHNKIKPIILTNSTNFSKSWPKTKFLTKVVFEPCYLNV